MKYNALAFSCFSISEIGLGTMSFTPNQKENEQIIDLALAKGINFLDTADLYQKGDVERMLSHCLRGKRNQLIVATKVGNIWNSDGKSWHWDASPKHIRAGLEESLKRLRTDYIDLYQLHGGTIEDSWNEIMETFTELKKEGKIRAFGVSSIRPNVIRKLSSFSGVSTLMTQYSFLDRRPEEMILPTIESGPMKMLARGIYAKGLLINKPPQEYLNYSQHEVKEFCDYLKSLGVKKEALAQRFVLQQPAMASAVIGVRTMDQLQETLLGYESLDKVSPEILNEIQKKVPVNFYDSHR